jgi:hypothetical protein
MADTAPPLTVAELDSMSNMRANLWPFGWVNRVIAQARRALTLESELAQLRRGIVANAGLLSNLRLPRWAHVRNAVGVGSTSARSMCRDAGFRPRRTCR